MWLLSFASFFSSLTTFPRLWRISYSGSKVFRSTPIPLGGRSRTCPMLAFTTKPSPRYLLIVLALAGDSTITRSLPFFLAIFQTSSCKFEQCYICHRLTCGLAKRHLKPLHSL